MGKRLYFSEGPLQVKFGAAGIFQLGVPREIPDYLADVLLRKGFLKEVIEKKSSSNLRKSKLEEQGG